MVHYSPFFGWKDVALGDLIKQKLGLPVYIENDVNTLTLTEQLFGAGRHAAHFVVATIGRGIGMGMVIHHQLYQGASGGVGELGHITHRPERPEVRLWQARLSGKPGLGYRRAELRADGAGAGGNLVDSPTGDAR